MLRAIVPQGWRKAVGARSRTHLRMPVLTFDTTHHALWAEEIAREEGVAHEIIPAPPAANARCDLALEVLLEDIGRLADLLKDAGVPHAIYAAPG